MVSIVIHVSSCLNAYVRIFLLRIFSDRLVGNWGRRPLELATLRLQNMVGISIQNWDTLAPDDEQLSAGVLTQLGGCILLGNDEEVKFSWKDPGICAVASFDDILCAL